MAALGADEPSVCAQTIVGQFGSLPRFVRASGEDLRSIPCLGEKARTAFTAARQLFLRSITTEVRRAPLCISNPAFRQYLLYRLGLREDEQLLGYFCDKQNRLLAESLLAQSQGRHINVSARHILRSAIQQGADRLVLVHNHPSGDCSPSAHDIHATRQVAEQARVVNIELHDHLIVGGGSVYSLRENRKL